MSIMPHVMSERNVLQVERSVLQAYHCMIVQQAGHAFTGFLKTFFKAFKRSTTGREASISHKVFYRLLRDLLKGLIIGGDNLCAVRLGGIDYAT